MKTLHFEGRDIGGYGEFVKPVDLLEGEIYFAVYYFDKDLLVPELRPFVFIGRDLEPDDSEKLYFQDADSYLAGVRYHTRVEGEGEIHRVHQDTPFVYDFDRALDRLLYCSLIRAEQRPTS